MASGVSYGFRLRHDPPAGVDGGGCGGWCGSWFDIDIDVMDCYFTGIYNLCMTSDQIFEKLR